MKPKMRFKGFDGEWKEKKLTDVVRLYNGLTYSPNSICEKGTLVLRSSNVQDGEITLNDNVYVESSVVNSPNVKKGDIIIVVRNGSRALIGKHAQIKNVMNDTVIGAFMTGMRSENPEFINALLGSFRFDYEIGINLGATINQITNATFRSMSFRFPSKDEQRTIGEYFTSLDAQISACASRIASLKQIKAASLQAMFPQEGETVPKVRFKGFKGEWKKCPLYRFAKKRTEKNTKKLYNITLTNSAEFGIIDQENFFEHSISKSTSITGYFVVREHDFVYNPRISSSAPVGPINQNKLGYVGVVSPLYFVFEVNGIHRDFLELFFQTTVWHKYMYYKGNTGARFDRIAISDEDFLKMSVPDIDLKEQQKIASYFTSLDRQITLHSQRLEKLKQIKAACLDKMFV